MIKYFDLTFYLKSTYKWAKHSEVDFFGRHFTTQINYTLYSQTKILGVFENVNITSSSRINT